MTDSRVTHRKATLGQPPLAVLAALGFALFANGAGAQVVAPDATAESPEIAAVQPHSSGEAASFSSSVSAPALRFASGPERFSLSEAGTAAAKPTPKSIARAAKERMNYTAIGGTFGQTVGNLRVYAFAQDRTAEVVSFIYIHPAGHLGPFRFDYMMQGVPLYVIHQPKYYDYQSIALTTERRAVFGVDGLPVGARMIFDPKCRLQAGLSGEGGFAYFTRRILSEGATRLNESLEFSGFLQYEINRNSYVEAGYAFNHLSNSNIHLKNPGWDSNLIMVEYLVRLHRQK